MKHGDKKQHSNDKTQSFSSLLDTTEGMLHWRTFSNTKDQSDYTRACKLSTSDSVDWCSMWLPVFTSVRRLFATLYNIHYCGSLGQNEARPSCTQAAQYHGIHLDPRTKAKSTWDDASNNEPSDKGVLAL